MSTTCENVRVADAPWFTAARALLLEELDKPPLMTIEPTKPFQAFTLLFGEEPHISLQRDVREAYDVARRGERPRGPEKGYVYVYRDSRDEDVSIVKIGSTTNVKRRLAQWQRRLEAKKSELQMLFVFESDDIRLAEQVAQKLLRCNWLHLRTEKATGRRLLEYYRVTDLEALALFMDAVARHTTWYARWRILKTALL